jgi:hypothetical protein
LRAADEGIHSITSSAHAKRPLTASDWQRPPTPLFPIHEEPAFHDDPVMQNIGGFDSKACREPVRRQTAAAGLTNITQTSGQESSRDFTFARPTSMSNLTFAQLDHDLSMSIPPPRELPFKVKSRDGTASRQTSSADLHSLPKPNFIDTTTMNSINEAGKNKPASRGQKAATRPTSATKATAKKPVTTQKKAAGAKATLSKLTSTEKSLRPMTAERPGTAASSSSTAAGRSYHTPITSEDIDRASLSKDINIALDRIDTAMTSAANATLHSRVSDQDSLADYAAMKYEERMAVIEKLIVEGVDDENFITLCEDVQSCWQRIGFGRQVQ